MTSKVGSKTNALKVNPGDYLVHFGESGTLTDSVAAEAEKYLDKMIQPKSKCSTINQLRYDYQINRKTPLPDLPPTSYSIQMHLLRCSFVVHQGTSLIRNPVDQDPTEFGWFKEGQFQTNQESIRGTRLLLCKMWL